MDSARDEHNEYPVATDDRALDDVAVVRGSRDDGDAPTMQTFIVFPRRVEDVYEVANRSLRRRGVHKLDLASIAADSKVTEITAVRGGCR